MPERRTYFVAGTDTGVGKTVVTTMMIRHLRAVGESVMGVKPFCSGGRSDARLIQKALGGAHTLDEINPWSFRASLTPLVAARREGVTLRKADCLKFLRKSQKSATTLIIEGAGGLLSPLGEGFDARDLIEGLDAIPIIVCMNKLGVINHTRLTLHALSNCAQSRAKIALIQPIRSSTLAKTNLEILSDFVGKSRIVNFPWINQTSSIGLTKNIAEAIQTWLNKNQNR